MKRRAYRYLLIIGGCIGFCILRRCSAEVSKNEVGPISIDISILARLFCLGLLGLLLISCIDSSPDGGMKTSEVHQIHIDVDEAIPVHGFDLIRPTFYHRLDTAYRLSLRSTARVLREFNQITLLQQTFGTSDFVIYDSLGRLKKSIDGLHSGPNNFAHACDAAAISDKNRYDILVRNPTRMVSVSSDGQKMVERSLPFSETYMDFYYNDNKYLFIADNVLPLGEPNLRSTDDQFYLIETFDPVDPIQVQTLTWNRDKLHFDYENNRYLHQPSLIYDSIYTLSMDGNYQPFGVIEKPSPFSKSELRQMERSGAPFKEYKKLRRSHKNNRPVMNLFISGDLLIIPYGTHIAIYDMARRKTITFEIISDEMNLFDVHQSNGQMFILRTAYQIAEDASTIYKQSDRYPDQVREYMDYAQEVDANDNMAIIDFDWNLEFIHSHFD